MFIRKLEKGECAEHGRRCRAAALMQCEREGCGNEFIVHKTFLRKQSYCSPQCAKIGNAAAIARALETKKRWQRIKYGRSFVR